MTVGTTKTVQKPAASAQGNKNQAKQKPKSVPLDQPKSAPIIHENSSSAKSAKNTGKKVSVTDTTPESGVVSKRPDGSVRKPVSVKPGYVPPEESPKYEIPALRMKKTSETNVSAQAAVEKQLKSTENVEKRQKKKANKPAKVQETTVSLSKETKLTAVHTSANTQKTTDSKGQRLPQKAGTKVSSGDAQLNKIRKIRKIRNLLYEIRVLEAKLGRGERLADEQLIKISRREQLGKDLVNAKKIAV